MLEFLVQLLGEFLIQVIGQVLVELGMHAMIEPFLKPPKPWVASVGYAIFGLILGLLSLFAFPEYLVHSGGLRIANLILTPMVVGACMAALGAWRVKRGDNALRIDKFAYGYLFALSIAIVRFWCAK
jgi:hypothetical protein